MRVRPIVFTLIMTFIGLPTFAASREEPRTPRDQPKIVKIIKRLFQSLDNPYISPPRP